MMSMGMKIPAGTNLLKAETGGGSVLDVAVYPIQLALAVFGGQMPEKVATKF